MHVEGLQSHHLYLVVHPLLHANTHVLFFSFVVINLLTPATLEIVHHVRSLWQKNVSVGMWFFATFLVDRRTLGVTNYVGRPGAVGSTLVRELATRHLVTHLLVLLIHLFVDKRVVPREKIVGTHVQLFATQENLVLM